MQHSDKMREAVLELQCSRAPPERTFRIIVLGAPGVGKTTIVNRFLFVNSSSSSNGAAAKPLSNSPSSAAAINHQNFITNASSINHISQPAEQRVFANNYPTSGDNYHRKVYNIRGDVFELDVVDTSGFNPFPALKSQRMGIMSGDLFCIVFSLTSASSFEYARHMRQEIIDIKRASFVEHLRSKKSSHHNTARTTRQHAVPAGGSTVPTTPHMTIAAAVAKRVQVPMILVGNKMDACESSRQVSKIDINQYLTSFQEDDDMPYVVCSAISGLYVPDIFALLFAFSRLPPELLTAPTLLSSICEHGLTNDGSNSTTTADTLYYGYTNNNNAICATNSNGLQGGSLTNASSSTNLNGTAQSNNIAGVEKKRRFSIVPRTQSTRHKQQQQQQQSAAITTTDVVVVADENSVISPNTKAAESMRRKTRSRLSISRHDKLMPTNSNGSQAGSNGAIIQNGNLTSASVLRANSVRRSPASPGATAVPMQSQPVPRAFATVMAYARRPSLRSEIETIKWRQDNPFYILKRNSNESFARRLISRLGIGELCSNVDVCSRRGRWWPPMWTSCFHERSDFHALNNNTHNNNNYPQYGKARARSNSREDTLRKLNK